jgi:DNA topoisomerase-1
LRYKPCPITSFLYALSIEKNRFFDFFILQKNELKKELKTENTGAEKNKLSHTDIGIVVTDFLVEHFGDIMDYTFTADVEKEFDEIAQGLLDWTDMIHKFYKPFHDNVENTLETSERASGERFLGNHPENGKPIIARIGRFGPMVQIGEQNDEEKPQFASLTPSQSITSISLDEALDLFRLPRNLGQFEGKDIKANIGRFGPYIQHANAFTSIPKGEDPISLTLERAIEIIQDKRISEAAKLIKTFSENPEMQLLNGRFGPYLKIGKENFKLPKNVDVEKLSYTECVLISQDPAAQSKKTKGKKTTKK